MFQLSPIKETMNYTEEERKKEHVLARVRNACMRNEDRRKNSRVTRWEEKRFFRKWERDWRVTATLRFLN